jgi:hypothetical protein
MPTVCVIFRVLHGGEAPLMKATPETSFRPP